MTSQTYINVHSTSMPMLPICWYRCDVIQTEFVPDHLHMYDRHGATDRTYIIFSQDVQQTVLYFVTVKSVISISLICLAACELLPIDIPFVSISWFIGQMSSIVEIIEKANNRALQANIPISVNASVPVKHHGTALLSFIPKIGFKPSICYRIFWYQGLTERP